MPETMPRYHTGPLLPSPDPRDTGPLVRSKYLAKVGVRIVDGPGVRLGCLACGAEWTAPTTRGGAMLAFFFWACPEGCNVPLVGKPEARASYFAALRDAASAIHERENRGY
jgi:hypothetical protein